MDRAITKALIATHVAPPAFVIAGFAHNADMIFVSLVTHAHPRLALPSRLLTFLQSLQPLVVR